MSEQRVGGPVNTCGQGGDPCSVCVMTTLSHESRDWGRLTTSAPAGSQASCPVPRRRPLSQSRAVLTPRHPGETPLPCQEWGLSPWCPQASLPCKSISQSPVGFGRLVSLGHLTPPRPSTPRNWLCWSGPSGYKTEGLTGRGPQLASLVPEGLGLGTSL